MYINSFILLIVPVYSLSIANDSNILIKNIIPVWYLLSRYGRVTTYIKNIQTYPVTQYNSKIGQYFKLFTFET